MGKLPVLKPREVCRLLEALGFVLVRQCSTATVMDGGPQFLITQGGIFRRFCSDKLPMTLA